LVDAQPRPIKLVAGDDQHFAIRTHSVGVDPAELEGQGCDRLGIYGDPVDHLAFFGETNVRNKVRTIVQRRLRPYLMAAP
jgi:hypothetical protein